MGRAVSLRCLTVALLVFVFAAAPASAAPPQVVATGLDDPRGIWAEEGDHGDRLLVAETLSGDITEIFVKKGDSAVRPFATGVFPSDVIGYGWNTAFATAGVPPEVGGGPFAGLVRVPRNGESDRIADIAAYQETDPDPVDQEDNPTETNPFGLAKVRSGILVVDSAGNDLLEIEKDGDIETVARFPTRQLPFPEGIPDGPPPGTPIDSEAVPTAVATGPDGAWYVSELRGFPFTPGSSRIWRIEPGTEDATCDPDAKRGPCRVYADGFTSVIDIAWSGRSLIVLEIAKDGLLALETAPPEGPIPPGALWVIEKGKKTELAAGELIAPGGVAVADEDLYVTTGTAAFEPDRGAVVRIKDALDDDDDHPGDGGHGGGGHHGDDDDDDDRGDGHHGDRGDHKGDRGRDRDRGDRHHKKYKHHRSGKRSKHKSKKRYKRYDD